MRARTRWNKQDKVRSLKEIAGAVGVVAWRIAGQGVLHLENEGFQTDTQVQRLDVIGEFGAFLVHVADRLVYARLSEAERQRFVNAMALHLADTMHANRTDIHGAGDHRGAFIALVNQRTDEYAGCPFSVEDGPGFSFRRTFGDRVTAVMGPKDRKWITDYVMEIEVPKAVKTLQTALANLLDSPQVSRA